MKKATIYTMKANREGKKRLEQKSGYTFEKAGMRFEVFKSYNEFIILLAGTGTKCAYSYKLKEAPEAITDDLIEKIHSLDLVWVKKEYAKLLEEMTA